MVLELLIFLILILLLRYSFKKLTEPFFSEAHREFPRIIWTYWDTPDLPRSVQTCIDTWKKQNPTYEIRVVNNQNIRDYLDEDLTQYPKLNDTVKRFSDLVRLSVLEKYGGIWSDATILCNKPYSWIEEAFQTRNYEFAGYYLDKFTKPELKDYAPVVESWFLAAIPGSPFIRDWRREFFRLNSFSSPKDYIDDIEKTTDLQNIDAKEYLAIHAAAQKILQKNKNAYSLYLQKAEDGPYKYLNEANWDSEAAVKKLVTTKDYTHLPVIKLRGGERGVLESILKDRE